MRRALSCSCHSLLPILLGPIEMKNTASQVLLRCPINCTSVPIFLPDAPMALRAETNVSLCKKYHHYMYMIYMKTTHFCTAFHGHVSRCFWTLSMTEWSLSFGYCMLQVNHRIHTLRTIGLYSAVSQKFYGLIFFLSLLSHKEYFFKDKCDKDIKMYSCHCSCSVTHFNGREKLFIPVCLSHNEFNDN